MLIERIRTRQAFVSKLVPSEHVIVGLRAAFPIDNEVTFGLIPTVNVGLADFGGAKGFAEAAFPTVYVLKDLRLTIVPHTGTGF